jgi:hypothetical protein
MTINDLSTLLNTLGLMLDIFAAYKLFYVRLSSIQKVDKLPDTVYGSIPRILVQQTIDEINKVLHSMNNTLNQINEKNEREHQSSKKWLWLLILGFLLQLIGTTLQFQIPKCITE